ncbi:MAG: zinc ribbon domain-containing protein [Chloroflexi bacterium]|nr:zinc ribbon domain-containing protein [Chloroflexota bacterium]
MPLYDFQCKECGEIFEVTLRFSEADRIPACPKCESKNTKKQLSKIAAFVTSSSSGSQGSASNSNCGSQGGFT